MAAVIREKTDADAPLSRTGIRSALTLVDGGRVLAILTASRRDIADDVSDFDVVFAEVGRTGGFLHILEEEEEAPHA